MYVKLGVSTNDHYFKDYYQTYYHNDDGTKTISISFDVETEISEGANANLNNYCFKYANIRATLTLPSINRISSFTVNNTCIMGNTTNFTINPYVSSFRHKLYWHFGNASGLIGENLSTSASFTFSKDLGYQIPNATSGVGVLTLQTYSGSTLIGSSQQNFTLWTSGDMVPSFSYTYNINNSYNGLCITEYSSITFTIDNAQGSYGSTIKSYSISGEGLNTTNSSGTTSVFQGSGIFTYTLSVTDSRNRTVTQQQSIPVYYYTKPALSIVSFGRTDEDHIASSTGNWASMTLAFDVKNPGGQNVNSKTITVGYREKGSTGSYTTLETLHPSKYKYDDFFIGFTTATFELNKAYEFRVSLKDDKKTTTLYAELPTATAILEISPNGVGIGKYHEQGTLDISGDMYIDGKKFYETGTFNPAFYVSDGCSGVYTRRHGFYQKVGEWCTCNISLVVENFFNGSTPSNQFKIINLPYYNKGGYTAVTIGHQSGLVFTNADSTTRAYIRPNEADVVFVITRETAGASYSVTGGNIPGSNIDIQVSFTYKVE